MADISALYPQPPQQQQQPGLNVLTNPAAAVQLMQGITNLQNSQQEQRARNAIGDIYRENIRPDGTLDEHGAVKGILKHPDAAWKAGEAISGMLERHGQELRNDTAAIGLQEAQTKAAAGIFAAIDPTKGTPEELVHRATVLAKATYPGVPSPVLNAWAQTILTDPEGVAHGVGNIRNFAIGAAGATEARKGPPDPVTGRPTEITKGQANLAGGPVAVGLPPGESTVMEGASARAERLQSTASTAPQYHADLENLKQDSKVLGNIGGPTVSFEKSLNQTMTRLGLPGITMTPEQLKATESFDKIANQISTSQAGNLGAATDAGRHMVVGANPSTSMSAFGREGVIDMLQGNQDAIDTTRKLWMDARAKGVAANSYDTFIHGMSKTLDPRVFQFNRLSRENQQTFLHQLSPDEFKEFEQKFVHAVKEKWVAPLKKVSE